MNEYLYKNEQKVHELLKDIVADESCHDDEECSFYIEHSEEIINLMIKHAKAIAMDTCIDNYRFANISKPHQLSHYKFHLKNGCCGFNDDILISPNGETYIVGCNSGH